MSKERGAARRKRNFLESTKRRQHPAAGTDLQQTKRDKKKSSPPQAPIFLMPKTRRAKPPQAPFFSQTMPNSHTHIRSIDIQLKNAAGVNLSRTLPKQKEITRAGGIFRKPRVARTDAHARSKCESRGDGRTQRRKVRSRHRPLTPRAPLGRIPPLRGVPPPSLRYIVH